MQFHGGKMEIIAAIGENNVIGHKGAIPWHISEDFKLFKKITTGHPIIMGRTTFESIGSILPNRTNIIVSSTLDHIENATITPSLTQALEVASQIDSTYFVIGGERLYKEAMPLADTLHISHIKGTFAGDRFFPVINIDDWKVTDKKEFEKFTYKKYTRNTP